MTPTTDTRDLLAEIERLNERIIAWENTTTYEQQTRAERAEDECAAALGKIDRLNEWVATVAQERDAALAGRDNMIEQYIGAEADVRSITAQVRELREAFVAKSNGGNGACWCNGPRRHPATEAGCVDCAHARAALSRTEPREAPTIRESQTVGPDLGPCPVSGECRGRVHALISEDGSAWEADLCNACGRRWWHDPPKLPHLAKLDTPARSDTVAVDPRTHEAAMAVVKAARLHLAFNNYTTTHELSDALAFFDTAEKAVRL